jgi:hypothetical protein
MFHESFDFMFCVVGDGFLKWTILFILYKLITSSKPPIFISLTLIFTKLTPFVTNDMLLINKLQWLIFVAFYEIVFSMLELSFMFMSMS